MTERITSRKNPLITRVRRLLSNRGARREEGVYAGDGVKLLQEAVRWRAPLETVLFTQGAELPPIPQGVRTVELPKDVMDSVSPMESPQGALFLCRQPALALPERLEGMRYLVLDGLQDPGNVGTIWRTADAFGADGLILVNHCADPFGPKAVRASMGACFRLPVWEAEPEELTQALSRAGLPLYATALGPNTQDVRRADLSRGAVVIGSEGRGVSQIMLACSQGSLRIPMRERCESLNAAAAAAVVLWQMGGVV